MHAKWVDSVLPRHQALTRTICSLLEGLLRKRSVDFLSVEGRTKDRMGIIEKIERKKYERPSNQLTDISGIRIVTFLESGLDETCALIREIFEIDEVNSLDKSDLLKVDQIGYRSVHSVCTLGDDRLALPEFADFGDLKFEIQVRTVLQHAWAELAHDRSYKFSGKLPATIERKMNLYAGMLELADSGFQELSDEIDEYSAAVSSRTAAGDLNIEINSTSTGQYLQNKTSELGLQISDDGVHSDIIEELKRFRVRNLRDLDSLFSKDFIDAYRKQEYSTTMNGLCRDLMIFADIDRYFADAYSGWHIQPDEDFQLPREKYTEDEIRKIISMYESD